MNVSIVLRMKNGGIRVERRVEGKGGKVQGKAVEKLEKRSE